MARRAFKGTCALCGTGVTRARAAAHLKTCAPAHEGRSGPVRHLLALRVTAVGAPVYWLDIEADADAALSKLDAFLRRIWLECCGHLSMFVIPPFRYSSPGSSVGLFGRPNTDRSMRADAAHHWVFSDRCPASRPISPVPPDVLMPPALLTLSGMAETV